MDTLSGEATVKIVFVALLKRRSTLKGNNLLSSAANSFLFEKTPSQKGLDVQGSKTGSHKSYLPCEKWQKIYQVYLPGGQTDHFKFQDTSKERG